MAYSTPPSWAAGNVVTAAKLTIVSDDITYLEASYEAWTSYTPTLTQSGAVTKTVTYAKYAKFGRTVHCQGVLTITGTGSGGVAVLVGLPVTAAAAAGLVVGSGVVKDTSAALFYGGEAMTQSTTTFGFISNNAGVANLLGVTDFTAALANTDIVTWAITYESAT